MLDLASIKKQVEARTKTYMLGRPSDSVRYASGLEVKIGRPNTWDPADRENDDEREILFYMNIDNKKGKAKVFYLEKKISICDDQGNVFSIVPCRESNHIENARHSNPNPFIVPGAISSFRFCALIPGKMDVRRLKVRFDDGSGEEKWLGLH